MRKYIEPQAHVYCPLTRRGPTRGSASPYLVSSLLAPPTVAQRSRYRSRTTTKVEQRTNSDNARTGGGVGSGDVGHSLAFFSRTNSGRRTFLKLERTDSYFDDRCFKKKNGKESRESGSNDREENNDLSNSAKNYILFEFQRCFNVNYM